MAGLSSTAATGRELGYAEIATVGPYTTTATVLTDVPGLSVTKTLTKSTIVLITVQADFANCSAAFLGGVALNEDGTDLGVIAGIPAALTPLSGARRRTVAAGEHTWKLRTSQGSAGTVTIQHGPGTAAGQNSPFWLRVTEVVV